MLIGEASVRIDALTDDLKKSINRDINEALKGIKIDSDPLVKMTQDLRKAELDLITAEDAQREAAGRVTAAEQELERVRKTEGSTAKEITAAERVLTRTRAEAAVAADKVTTVNLRLAQSHGALSRQQAESERSNRSWLRSLLSSSSGLKGASSDTNGFGRVLDTVLKGGMSAFIGQFQAMGSVGSGAFSALTSQAGLMGGAITVLLALVGGLITALPALAAVGGVALGAILLGMDGIKRAFGPLKDDLAHLKTLVSDSFEHALAPAVAKMPALFGAMQVGLQSMATALGGTVTQITNLVTQSDNLAKIKELFNQTARFIQGMQPGINAFVQGFLNLGAAVAPQLRELGTAFGFLVGAIGNALSDIAASGQVNQIISGLAQVLQSVGRLLNPVIGLLARLGATLQGPLATIIDAIATGLQAAMPGIQAFADGFARALVAIGPVLSTVLPLVGQLAGLIGSVLGTAVATLAPPLTKLIQGLAAGLAPVLPKIASAFESLGAALGPVLDQLAGALVDSLDKLLPIIPQLVGALVTMAPAFLDIVKAVIPLIPPLVELIATILPGLIRLWLLIEKPMYAFTAVLLGKVVPALISFVEWVTGGVGKVIDFFTDFDTNVSVIWSHIVTFFKGIGESIGGFFSGIGDKIVGWFQAGVDFIAGLPGKIGDFLSTLPGIVGAALLQAGQAMLDATVQGVEWVIAEILALPFQIAAALFGLSKLMLGIAADAWGWFINTAKTIGADLVTWVAGLPGRIWAALQSLTTTLIQLGKDAWNAFVQSAKDAGTNLMAFTLSIPTRIREALNSLGSTLRNIAVNAFTAFVDSAKNTGEAVFGFARSIPGRVLDALGNIAGFLYNAGKNIIQGFINGIKAAAGAIGGVVSDILAKVRNLLPFSPAKEGPFSGRGYPLYSGMALMEALADGLRIAGVQVVDQAAQIAAAVQGALSITPVIDVPDLGAAGAGRVPDLSRGPQSTAEAQLTALTAVADTLLRNGQRLPDDLAAALESLRVVVSAQEISSGVKTIDQQDERRR